MSIIPDIHYKVIAPIIASVRNSFPKQEDEEAVIEAVLIAVSEYLTTNEALMDKEELVTSLIVLGKYGEKLKQEMTRT